MAIPVLYICIVFSLFSILSMILVHYSFQRSASVTRYLITCCNILICVDTALYLNNAGWLLANFSNVVQSVLKETIGMVFIYRNEFWDYAFSLIVFYCLYIVAFCVEALFRPAKTSHKIDTYKGQSKRRHSKTTMDKIATLVSILSTIITTLLTLLSFIVELLK